MRWFGAAADSGGLGHFTPPAQVVLALARMEANRLHHSQVNTEHLLLGLLRLGEGLAVTVLHQRGLTFETVNVEVEKLNASAAAAASQGSVPYTPVVMQTLKIAMKEAKALHHDYLGTEHMLLALLAEKDGIAAQVLKNLGVDLAQTREEILKGLHLGLQTDSSTHRVAPLKQLASTGGVSVADGSNFTPRTQETIRLAQEEAKRLRHHFTGSEHLLLGLVKLGGGVAVNVLRKQGVDFERLCVVVEQLAFPIEYSSPNPAVPIMPPLTPAALRALSHAQQEASALKHTYVGTEHVLLGLLHEEAGTAAKLLKDLGLQLLPLRMEILKELDPNFGA